LRGLGPEAVDGRDGCDEPIQAYASVQPDGTTVNCHRERADGLGLLSWETEVSKAGFGKDGWRGKGMGQAERCEPRYGHPESLVQRRQRW